MSPREYSAQTAVLENADLLRLLGEYLIGSQLPFILSFKAVRDALKPLNTTSGNKWIKSKKNYLVTSVAVVEWAQSLGCEFSLSKSFFSLFAYAASNGSVDVLRWAHKKYPPHQYSAGVRNDVCCNAAANGHLEVLKYLNSLDTIVEWGSSVCGFAIVYCHLHTLQWLREVLDPPCPWSDCTCTFAAIHGHLHVLQRLRVQDPPCPWGGCTCWYAATNGYLDMLKWLRSQEPPCPWDKQWCLDGARDENLHEVIEWILLQTE